MRITIARASTALALALLALLAPLAGTGCHPKGTPMAQATSGVRNPHVSTDRSVDASSVERILASLIRKKMTGEQKVLAVFHWVRRAVYHGDGLKKHASDFHYLVNVSGHGSCLRQTRLIAILLDRLGYRTRNWTRRGHHLMEVRYAGAWHCFDPHMTFYVYNRAKPPAIASVAELKADPSLALAAVKEKRACPGYLLCGDPPKTFAGPRGWKNYGEFPEAFEVKTSLNEPFGRITLRRGETYIRTWWPGKYWYRKDWHKKDVGPYHGCGRRDRNDTVNWPLYEAHGWDTPQSVTYRHWGAGRLVYQPDLSGDGWRDALVGKATLTSKNTGGREALVPTKKGQAGTAVFSVGCPYVLTAGKLEIVGTVKAAVSVDAGKTWKPIPAGEIFRDQIEGSLSGYLLKLVVPPGAGVTSLKLTSHFQLNPYALPHLAPGKNVVKVEAAPFDAPLTVTYRWSQGEEQRRSTTRRFTKNGSFEINIPGQWFPRMKELVLSVAP